MKKYIITIVLIIALILLLIPIKRDIPNNHKCKCLYYSYNIYKAGLYTYVEKYIYIEDENHSLILDENQNPILDKKVKKIFWWPMNNWGKINDFVIPSP